MATSVVPQTPELTPGSLVTQPHGGSIRRGNPGNKGGRSHPDRIRRMSRQMLVDRLPILGQIADGVTVRLETTETIDGQSVTKWELFTPGAKERVSALKVLADIGMGAPVTMSDIRERLQQQATVIQSRTTWDSTELLDALSGVWK